MRIALDYDGTYTLDPDLWCEFIGMARNNGHEVWIVTMTHTGEKEKVRDVVDGIIYSELVPKKDYCDSNGIHFDIWIDDSPELLTF